ncbi:hypothetical protein N9U81_04330 [Candidatus Pelagibacter sp.]|nr:hypothetical protein [Candidatus Pelagibacter sp.]|tara:strand:+ start:1031 stop:1456 length:426 start_codon:yes stop_codon:yes gene_type:complete
MILISHRGNIDGVNKLRENKIDYINEAIKNGFDVEIDVWYKKNEFYLGHDNPVDKVSKDYLKNNSLWCHAKNFESLQKMLENDIHCFFHDTDKYTLTSRNYIWAFPGIDGGENTIAVKPEGKNLNLIKFSGICSDNIINYK